MGRNVKDLIAEESQEDQAYIAKRGQELVEEVLSLSEVRKLVGRTQVETSEKLNINQQNVSKLEKRTDVKLSTLRNYIEALGGRLDVVATFPDRDAVSLNGIGQE